jgi:SDR family mycofactocin-dependent oxidoreductase
MTSRLEGKIALITGAARGIGRAQAVRFAEEGADIIAVDVCTSVETTVTPPATEADLDETVAQIRALGRKVESAVVDVRDLEALRSAVDSAVGMLGGLDIVCATAGITSSDGALTMSETMWQTMLDVNLTGGSMTLTSSIAGLRGLVGVAHYTAAKHGVVGLMRSLAKELAPHNVRVNTVHPTNVDTLMIQNPLVRGKFRPDLENPTREEFAAAAMTMNMLAIPWIEPVDVANAALFLSSDEARYITSVALPVDAGSSSR